MSINKMHQHISGKRYLLTGASQGMGAMIAKELCIHGAFVVGVARSQDLLMQLAQEIENNIDTNNSTDKADSIPRFQWKLFDLSQSDQVFKWSQKLWDHYGPFDGVIHNAGVDDFLSFHLKDAEDIHLQLQLNLNTPILINRALLPKMLNAQHDSVIIHMSSVAGYIPTPYGCVYSATKAGLWIYNQALMQEYRNTKVRFLTLHPGFIHGTGMHERHKELAGAAPIILGGTSVRHVVRAVLKGLYKGEGDHIINHFPVRPFVAFLYLFPRVYRWIAHYLVTPYLAKVAEAIYTKK
jgi:short-subunit dehydrogenase